LISFLVFYYAWGTALLAHIKNDLAYIKKGEGKSKMCCFTLALIVFALERFPCLTQGMMPNLPTAFPLSLGWIDVIANQLNISNRRKTVQQWRADIMENNIEWKPYSSDRLRVPRDIEDQLILRYVVVPCINFFQVCMVRPDICFRQLGIEGDLKQVVVPERNLIKFSTSKGIDMRSYVGRKKCNYRQLNNF
jgi:hypothetical protein